MNRRITNIILPIIAVIVYIAIDLVYIFLAKDRYEAVVVNIQKGEKVQFDIVAGVITYVVLAIGWYFIAVSLAFSYFDKLKQHRPTWTPLSASALSGLVAGVLYGLVVYGVYNLTTRVLFSERYPLSILLQDIAWGSLFNMVYTCIYMIIWGRLALPVDL
ncbi:hypothetical protein I4U23_030868 [Adineta vaga]|nr:hypothetical protein I4U23_030868 [Adineta vaga]